MVLETNKDEPMRSFTPTDMHNDFHSDQWKQLSKLKEEDQPVVLVMPMDSEIVIETHGTRLQNRSSDGELVPSSPGQVMVMSWRTWYRTAKPFGSHHTRRNKRLVVFLGKDKK